MGFRELMANAFSSGAQFIATNGAHGITGPVKDVSGAVKDVTGIRKDLVETKLAENKLRTEESLIQKATLEDVKLYDPRTRALLSAIGRTYPDLTRPISSLSLLLLYLLLLLSGVFLVDMLRE